MLICRRESDFPNSIIRRAIATEPDGQVAVRLQMVPLPANLMQRQDQTFGLGGQESITATALRGLRAIDSCPPNPPSLPSPPS